jgi:hypothetical protein
LESIPGLPKSLKISSLTFNFSAGDEVLVLLRPKRKKRSLQNKKRKLVMEENSILILNVFCILLKSRQRKQFTYSWYFFVFYLERNFYLLFSREPEFLNFSIPGLPKSLKILAQKEKRKPETTVSRG